MGRKHWLIFFIIFVAGIAACNKNDIAPSISFQKPTNFPEPVYRFASNTITKERFELGKKLFYDPILSANSTISCGSCHIQTSAFTHHGHIVSHGIFDRMGTRNSPPIMNLAWSTSFMWRWMKQWRMYLISYGIHLNILRCFARHTVQKKSLQAIF